MNDEVNVKVDSLQPYTLVEYAYNRFLLIFHSAHGHRYASICPPKFPVAVGSIITVQPFAGDRSLVWEQRPRSDLTWEMLLRDAFPYYIGYGKSSTATCRTCYYRFSKNELRVRFEVNRKLSGCVTPACEVSVCMKMSCIQNCYRNSRNAVHLVMNLYCLTFCSLHHLLVKYLCRVQ